MILGTWDWFKCLFNPLQPDYILGSCMLSRHVNPSIYTSVLHNIYFISSTKHHFNKNEFFVHICLSFLFLMSTSGQISDNTEITAVSSYNSESINEISPLHFWKIQNISCICSLPFLFLQPSFKLILDWG